MSSIDSTSFPQNRPVLPPETCVHISSLVLVLVYTCVHISRSCLDPCPPVFNFIPEGFYFFIRSMAIAAAHGLNVRLRPRPQGFTMPAKWHSLTILCASAAALVERTSSSGSSGHGGSGASALSISIRHRSKAHRLISLLGREILSWCRNGKFIFYCHEM